MKVRNLLYQPIFKAGCIPSRVAFGITKAAQAERRVTFHAAAGTLRGLSDPLASKAHVFPWENSARGVVWRGVPSPAQGSAARPLDSLSTSA